MQVLGLRVQQAATKTAAVLFLQLAPVITIMNHGAGIDYCGSAKPAVWISTERRASSRTCVFASADASLDASLGSVYKMAAATRSGVRKYRNLRDDVPYNNQR
jgi:hypothetical protein